MNLIDKINAEQTRDDHPVFEVGDTITVHTLIVEGVKERVQKFTGTVIGRKGGGHDETVTVRRVVSGLGVERIFPLSSPRVAKIELTSRGDVARAKLYYLRDRVGKAARVKEKVRGAK
jgi:large subunit ribosomal protein L19